jgi:imidazoleglycerol phosphate dehydratase HisB
LARPDRTAEITRKTKETEIKVRNLDRERRCTSKPAGFFDHMLEQIARHGGLRSSLQGTAYRRASYD